MCHVGRIDTILVKKERTEKGGTQMKTVNKITLGIGKVLAAIIGCALMPILIWIALGVAIKQKPYRKGACMEPVPTSGHTPIASSNKV
jgi:hypothetical protein